MYFNSDWCVGGLSCCFYSGWVFTESGCWPGPPPFAARALKITEEQKFPRDRSNITRASEEWRGIHYTSTYRTIECLLARGICVQGLETRDYCQTKCPKKSNLSDCNNWRGITLLFVPGNVFCIIVLRRLRRAADSRLRAERAGFRSERSCVEQILTLRNNIEHTIEFKKPFKLHRLQERVWRCPSRNATAHHWGLWNSTLLHQSLQKHLPQF